MDIRLEDIGLDEFIVADKMKTSLMLEDNGLKDKLLVDYRLMWNVEIEDGTETVLPDLISNDSGEIYQYFYDSNDGNVFIYPQGECDAIYKKKIKLK